MKICYITRPDLIPTTHGAAVKIVRTAEALSRRGATVNIVTNDRVWFFETQGGQLTRRRYPQALLSLTNIPPRFKDRLHRLGFPNYWRGLQGALDAIGYPRDEHFLYQPIIDLDFLLRVLYVGWAHDIDVFQAEFPGYAAPAIVAARILGKEAILAEHNVEYERLAATTGLTPAVLARLKDIELGLCQRVDRVVTCSELERDALKLEGVTTPIAAIPHGVELEPYRALMGPGERALSRQRIRTRYQIPPERRLLVFHGTLHYWPNTVAVKRIAEGLIPKLEALGQDVQVLICGMNPPRYYNHPRITFTEMVQDLPEHLAAGEVAVVPLEDGGGTRLKILEYFAARVPVVSTPKGAEGIPAREGVEILLADDLDAMAQAVARLLESPEEAAAIGLGGLRFAESYSWDAIAARWEDVYAGRDPAPIPLPDPLNGAPHPKAEDVGGMRPRDAKGRPSPKHPPHPSEIRPAPRDQEPRPLPADPTLGVADQLKGPIRPTKPSTMIMMINRGCNLRCDFCDLYERPQLFDEAEAIPILDDAARMGVRTVVFTGGEPTLHPGLWRMIRRAKDLGMGTNITTNGTTIERHLEAILSCGLDSLSVSIDGLKETHEALRKIDGCFDDTIAGLKALKARGGPHINIYFVVTGTNVGELIPVFDLAQSLGCGFDFWPVNDAHHLYIVDEASRAAYRGAIDTLAARDPAVAAKRDYYLAGLDYHAGWDKRVRCLGLVEQFGVNLSGELVPCCVWDNKDLTIGPLAGDKKKSLPELWYGDEARRRREQITETGCHNRCFNHSLYEYQLATGESFVVGEGEAPAHLSPGAPPLPPKTQPRGGQTGLKTQDSGLKTLPPPHLPGSYLVLELANGCNLKCQHCAQADPDHPHYKTTGFFPRAAIRALMDDLTMTGARFDTLILFWLGEPLLHPEFEGIYGDILERIRPDAEGNLAPFAKVEVHTNAILLTPALSARILNDHPVPQRWHFTVDAADKDTYRAIKGADQLARVEANVRAFYDLKAKGGMPWPSTALQYIVSSDNEAEADTFVARWRGAVTGAGLKVELVAHHVPEVFDREFVFLKSLDCPTPKEQKRQNAVYRRLVEGYGLGLKSGGAAAPARVKAKNLNPCSGFWKSPVISFDGMLTTCTRDNLGQNALGNVLKTPFSTLWWGPGRIQAWRAGVAKGDYGDRALCQTCFIPQSVNYTDITPKEIAKAQALGALEPGVSP